MVILTGFLRWPGWTGAAASATDVGQCTHAGFRNSPGYVQAQRAARRKRAAGDQKGNFFSADHSPAQG